MNQRTTLEIVWENVKAQKKKKKEKRFLWKKQKNTIPTNSDLPAFHTAQVLLQKHLMTVKLLHKYYRN